MRVGVKPNSIERPFAKQKRPITFLSGNSAFFLFYGIMELLSSKYIPTFPLLNQWNIDMFLL